MLKSGELKTGEDIVRRDERVVDQIVKNQLLRLEQPPRVDVVEMHCILRVFADNLPRLVFPQNKLTRTLFLFACEHLKTDLMEGPLLSVSALHLFQLLEPVRVVMYERVHDSPIHYTWRFDVEILPRTR